LKRIAGLVGALVPAGWFACTVALAAQDRRPAPALDARSHRSEYLGPGREDPPPDGLAEILLAYFGPPLASDPRWGDAWLGAQMAIEEANATDGFGGLPFRLVPAWSPSPWGSGVSDLARAVYGDRVWAIVGGVDGSTTHLAEQVAVKARLSMVSFGSTDKSVNLVNVAWALSCLPSDDAQAEVLVPALLAGGGSRPLAVLSTTDHDSHTAVLEYLLQIRRAGRAPVTHLELPAGAEEIGEAMSRIPGERLGAVLLIASAEDALRILRALRSSGYLGPVFGGATLGRRTFVEGGGRAAEGAVFPRLIEFSWEWDAFSHAFRRRHGFEPDYLAGQAFDAVRLVVAATRQAGANRARILDALYGLSPWRGATGLHQWDPTGRNVRPVSLATIRDGREVPFRGRGN
jgi:ABC-type branched-subunit amino acid transport system substrate-binding protein